MSKHTPTPWRDYGLAGIKSEAHCSMTTTPLVRCYGKHKEANAAFIVKAVNCHDELIAACQQALEALEDPELETGAYQSLAADSVLSALAKAGAA